MKFVTLKSGLVDLELAANGTLVPETSLRTAAIVSLLSDRRADGDDRLPYEVRSENPIPADRRGWAGDAFDNRRLGSRLWLLAREKQTTETLRRAIFYVREALQWMLDDGHAVSLDVEASWAGLGRLNVLIRLGLPGGESFETISAGIVYAV